VFEKHQEKAKKYFDIPETDEEQEENKGPED